MPARDKRPDQNSIINSPHFTPLMTQGGHCIAVGENLILVVGSTLKRPSRTRSKSWLSGRNSMTPHRDPK